MAMAGMQSEKRRASRFFGDDGFDMEIAQLEERRLSASSVDVFLGSDCLFDIAIDGGTVVFGSGVCIGVPRLVE